MSRLVIVIGSMPCAICGELMSQIDVENEQAILSGNTPDVMNVIAHLHHFYTDNHQMTPDFKLNQAKFAYAIGAQNGWDKNPENKQRAMDYIARLEKEYEHNRSTGSSKK